MSANARNFKTALHPELESLTQFRFIKELGAGGMGRVYLVENKLMGNRLEALKTLGAAFANHKEAALRFKQEIAVSSQLLHPNIVIAYSALELPSLLVLCMQYIDGPNLEQLVETSGPLSVELAIELLKQAAAALNYAHARQTIHRDIKPSNFMVDRTTNPPTLKAVDFGLAKVFKASKAAGLTSTRDVMGTPYFMSPEQFRSSANVDHRSDIYSLGCTAYYMLTGFRPFEGSFTDLYHQHLEEPPPSIIALRNECPAALERIIFKMMAKAPGDRFRSAAEITVALESLTSGTAAVDRAPVDYFKTIVDAPISPRRPDPLVETVREQGLASRSTVSEKPTAGESKPLANVMHLIRPTEPPPFKKPVDRTARMLWIGVALLAVTLSVILYLVIQEIWLSE